MIKNLYNSSSVKNIINKDAKEKRHFFPSKKLTYLFALNITIWFCLSILIFSNSFDYFNFNIALGTEISKVIILILWSIFFYILIQVIIEYKFTLFIKRIDKELKCAISENRQKIHFRNDNIFDWSIESLNELIDANEQKTANLDKQYSEIVNEFRKLNNNKESLKHIIQKFNELKSQIKESL